MFKISAIQYISQGNVPNRSHAELIEQACKGGADWVQLRVKDASEDEVKKQAFLAREICDSYNVRLIINDFPEVAKKVRADGLHLGKQDMDPLEARKLVGDDMIIGGTANTLEDVKALSHKKVDYIGYGPYRFTTTKKNLSPVVGLQGFSELVQYCDRENITIPLIAIGGIVSEDLDALFRTGISGVAISGVINHAEKPAEAMQSFLNQYKIVQKNLERDVLWNH
jgi:thiamine-phosphate pyrophosphorylase